MQNENPVNLGVNAGVNPVANPVMAGAVVQPATGVVPAGEVMTQPGSPVVNEQAMDHSTAVPTTSSIAAAAAAAATPTAVPSSV